MTYSFRIRVNRSPSYTINEDESELVIPSSDENISILLRSRNELAIKDSDQFLLEGSGYKSAEEANIGGTKYQTALMVALAHVRVGVDFGQRAAKGFFTKNGLKLVEEQRGQRFLNNTHGLMVYQSEPKPLFIESNGQVRLGTNRDSFIEAFTKSVKKQPIIQNRELIAFTFFNASFFQPTIDTRFLLLVMAIEALIEPIERSNNAIAHIDSLIEKTKSSKLEKKEKNSIIDNLRWLKQKSINQSGKHLVTSRLAPEKKYNEMSPEIFFSKCYKLRSNLVHGNLPIPTFGEIGNVVATLEVFVSDLLTNHIFCGQ